MSLEQEVDLLRNIPFFAKIDPAKLKLLAFTSERIAYAPGQNVFRKGEPGDAAYIVIEGSADILIEGGEGEVKVAEAKVNDLVGEIAILCDVPRTATVRAQTSLTVLRISKDLFFQLVNEFPAIAIEVMRELAMRLEATTARLRDAMHRDAEG
ncbi:MAG: Crp/Fnr family transcriptional regulator [Alphaproteobacteria bacterium]|nr:Crp/Fnr family transcriptional regulator [Alphaproteobacteria bacterium]